MMSRIFLFLCVLRSLSDDLFVSCIADWRNDIPGFTPQVNTKARAFLYRKEALEGVRGTASPAGSQPRWTQRLGRGRSQKLHRGLSHGQHRPKPRSGTPSRTGNGEARTGTGIPMACQRLVYHHSTGFHSEGRTVSFPCGTAETRYAAYFSELWSVTDFLLTHSWIPVFRVAGETSALQLTGAWEQHIESRLPALAKFWLL